MSYTDRNYNDCRNDILNITRKYYPDVFGYINDASIGSWLIDVLSDIYDNLNYHIDRTFQETTVDTAERFDTLLDLARTNGVKVPYKKAALVEIELSCNIPVFDGDDLGSADERYCPFVKRGTQFSNGLETFELVDDVDFKEQFNSDGISDRQIIPLKNSNGRIISYTYRKLGLASATTTKVMKVNLNNGDIEPFMNIEIPDSNVVSVESILVKEGTNIVEEPKLVEYYVDGEQFFDRNRRKTMRFFEVESLADQYRYGYDYEGEEVTDVKDVDFSDYVDDASGVHYRKYYNPIWEISEVFENPETNEAIPIRRVVKGKWKRLKNKFITEYTKDWRMKIIFGAGIRNKYGEIPKDATSFTKYQMSRMMANDYMGVLPDSNSTMFILYKVGGGDISNIAEGTLNRIISLSVDVDGNCNDGDDDRKIRNVIDSITVNNTTPSYGGKDAPSAEELRYLIKYKSASQNRCVTLKDYQAAISNIPAKFGCPFKTGVIEENNKIVIYSLGMDYLGHLTNFLSETVAENMKTYLSMYKMINDFVEIRSGKVINVSFKVTVYIDKTYDKADVTKTIIDLVYDYMDVRKHMMGEDIYLGDLQKEIAKLDGVVNLVKLQCYNEVGEDYSEDETTQEFVDKSRCVDDYGYAEVNDRDDEIDLEKSDYMLFSEANSMFEIKYKNRDIVVVAKVRK